MTGDELLARRRQAYRQTAPRRIRSEDEALRFIDEVGFCFIFSAEGAELPTLYHAIRGDAAPQVNFHDHATGLAWDWKDSLPIRRACFYGKLLRNKPVLVSLEMFPHFYALSDNFGDLDDYVQEYEDGHMSYPAKQIYEALLREGAMPTSLLRRKANLAGRQNMRDFDKGLLELQTGLKITKTAISDANRWHYCYVFDLIPRWLPEQVRQGLAISARAAQRTLLRRYLAVVQAATAEDVMKLFGWTRETVGRVIAELAEAGEVETGVAVEGMAGSFVTPAGGSSTRA